MGIFGKIQSIKNKWKEDSKKQRAIQMENDLIELKQLTVERKKLQEMKLLQDNLSKNKKQVRALKHPLLAKFGKNLKENMKKAKKKAKKKNENNPFMPSNSPFKFN